jgi:hypothetical protein
MSNRWKRGPYVPEGLTLNLRNPAQVVLFNEELAGQISDGVWENARPFNHWTWVPRAENVGISEAPGFCAPGLTWGFRPPRRYNFCDSLLIEVCGERMIAEVQTRLKGYFAYNLESLKADLRDISKIVNGKR